MVEQNIHTAIIEIMKNVTHIEKTGYNSFHGFKYASESDLIKALHEEMAKKNVYLYCADIVNELEVQNGFYIGTFTYRFVHALSGTHIDVKAKGEAMDKTKTGVGDKAIYKATTGSLKYALKQTFLIDTGDNDPDRDAPEKTNKKTNTTVVKKTTSDMNSKETKELLTQIQSDILILANQDKEAYKEILIQYTTFTNNEGKLIKGVDSLSKIKSLQRLQILRQKTKAAINKTSSSNSEF